MNLKEQKEEITKNVRIPVSVVETLSKVAKESRMSVKAFLEKILIDAAKKYNKEN